MSAEELVDAIAGFTLFADLTDPQLAGIIHTRRGMFAGAAGRARA
jgi:2-keto-4-pentenoate hydratase/2-oxohepta-3-ene-1,7-dioic acid hydratase in catechol pathway